MSDSAFSWKANASRMTSFGAVRNDREPLSNPRPLPYKPLPSRRESRRSNPGLARLSPLRKRAASPCPWSRLHQSGFATIHRSTWRPDLAPTWPPTFRRAASQLVRTVEHLFCRGLMLVVRLNPFQGLPPTLPLLWVSFCSHWRWPCDRNNRSSKGMRQAQ